MSKGPVFDSVEAFTKWELGPAPRDGSGASRQDAQRLDPKDDSAAREAGAPDPTPTLKREG